MVPEIGPHADATSRNARTLAAPMTLPLPRVELQGLGGHGQRLGVACQAERLGESEPRNLTPHRAY